MQRISFALGFLLLPIVLFAYSNPGLPAQAGKPTGFVNDFATVLSPTDKSALETKLSGLEKSTGDEVSIAIISSLGGDTIENFAVNLYKDWGLGKKGVDNGALILVSIEDRQIKIEVGYGLEPVLTDITTSHIISDTITPLFKNGDYAGGLSAGVDQIVSVLNGEVLSPSSSTRSSSFSSNFFYFILFGFIYLASILGRSKSWWMGGIVGGIVGVVVGLIYGFLYTGILTVALFIPLGLLFDFFVSRQFEKHKTNGTVVPWWIGGGGGHGGGFGGGGFGGFGGGMSGGGGSSGRW